MKLTRTDRWILSNQYRILAALYPDEASSFGEAQEVLDSGYEYHYETLIPGIYDGDETMTSDECIEVIDILAAFDAVQRGYDSLVDKSDINERDTRFPGFDGNNEGKQLGYAAYFCRHDGGRFTNLRRSGDGGNSHAPMLDAYRRVVQEWHKSADEHNLNGNDLVRIIAAWKHPQG